MSSFFQSSNLQQPAAYKEKLAVWEEFRQNAPRTFLKIKTAVFGSLTLITGAADVTCVCYAMKQRFIDATGQFNGNYLELLAISMMTLFCYIGIGILWRNDYKTAAKALFGVVLCALALTLWQTEISFLQQVWAGASGTSAGAFTDASAGSAASSAAPAWFLILGDFVFAFFFSMPGLLFTWFKHHLEDCFHEWRPYMNADKAFRRIEEHHAMEGALSQAEADLASLGSEQAYALRALDVACAEYRRGQIPALREAEAIAEDKLRTDGERQSASAKAGEIRKCLQAIDQSRRAAQIGRGARATVMGFLLLLVFACGGHSQAQSNTPLCLTAPTMQILVDASRSSPAMKQDFDAAVLPSLEQQVRSMPICSKITITTVGDASKMPIMLRTRVQLRNTQDGATMDDIVAGLRKFLLNFSQRTRGHEQMHSELIGGFVDAAENVNAQAVRPNVIVMLSDLVEQSRFAHCGTGTCRLPAPGFRLNNVEVTVYGVGLGLRSDRAISLTDAWRDWFSKTGARANLRRTF